MEQRTTERAKWCGVGSSGAMNRTAPISQVDVEREILRLMSMLEEETEAFESLAVD